MQFFHKTVIIFPFGPIILYNWQRDQFRFIIFLRLSCDVINLLKITRTCSKETIKHTAYPKYAFFSLKYPKYLVFHHFVQHY